MKISTKIERALIQENIDISSVEKLTKNQFIAKYKDSSNKTLRLAGQKLDQYYNKNIKRELSTNIIENGELTNNKRKYNKQIYRTLCIILGLVNKYSKDGNYFYIPITYTANCANTTERTVKKAINTLINNNIIEFIGYDRDNTMYAMCRYRIVDKNKLILLVQHGKELHDIEYKEEHIQESLKNNTKLMIEIQESTRIKDSLKAMKECPYLIMAFNKSNIFDGDFKQKFLLDARLRASSRFTQTKNPDNHPEEARDTFKRIKLLKELQEKNNSAEYVEYDLSASIYTLSYYLKYGDFPKKDFYDLFTYRLKEKYHTEQSFRTLKNNKKMRDMIKTFCMRIYMHGYNAKGKSAYIGTCKNILLEQKRLENTYIMNEIEYIDTIYKFFSGVNIEASNDIQESYYELYKNAYDIMLDLCTILRSKIFLYESLLCSLLISMGIEDGVQIVNAYDGFYMPADYINKFKKKLIPVGYKLVKEIYELYKVKSTRSKNKELLEYLEAIGKLYVVDNQKYVKILNTYINFYDYSILSTIERNVTNEEKS